MLRLSFNVVRESYWGLKYKRVFCSSIRILHRPFLSLGKPGLVIGN